MRMRHVLIILLSSLILVCLAPAQEEKKSSDRFQLFTSSEDPLEITADSMTADNKERIVIFTGNVTAVQAEAKLTAKKLEIRYREGEGQSQIQMVVASGDVVMTQTDRRATCDQAVYDSDSGKIVLTGTPEVWQGQDHIKGSVIEMYVDEDRVRVKSDPTQPVRVILFPQEGSKEKDGKTANGETGSTQPD